MSSSAQPGGLHGQRVGRSATVRRGLILSGSIGKGHDVVAEACAAALGRADVESKTFDSLELLPPGGGVAGQWVFRRLLSSAAVYDAFHFSQLRTGGRLASLTERAAQRAMWARFAEAANRLQPRLLLSVFATGAAAAARWKASHPDALSVVVCTDSFAHALWVHEETDLFIVTSQLGAAAVRLHRPRARVEIIGVPVRPQFYTAPDRGDARRTLGIPEDAPCVLLMSGSWGIGPLDECASLIAEQGAWVLAVAGSNDRLRRRLEAIAHANPRVVSFGFTDRIPQLMAACNVVVTSSGDTCSEARVVGRRLVLLDVVPGHGRENLMHELEVGGATAVGSDPRRIADAVAVSLEHAGTGDLPAVRSAERWEHAFMGALDRAGF
jgi:UDP-N-acetylglucosamine:LPS N-acetylglucosamine transferase